MSELVTLKSNRYGINLVLDPNAPFISVREAVIEKFKESEKFFKNAKIGLSFEGRRMSDDEELKLIDAIQKNSTVEVICIIDSNPENEEKTKRLVEKAVNEGLAFRQDAAAAAQPLSVGPQIMGKTPTAAQTAAAQAAQAQAAQAQAAQAKAQAAMTAQTASTGAAAHMAQTAAAQTVMGAVVANAGIAADGAATVAAGAIPLSPSMSGDFHRGTLRSGQYIESEGSVTVIGDVNPGAHITAAGNVVILGALKGNVQAGCFGDDNAFVFALAMDPIQIQIGEYIAKKPDEDKKPKKRIRRPKKEQAEEAQIAIVKEGAIYIEPAIKSVLRGI